MRLDFLRACGGSDDDFQDIIFIRYSMFVFPHRGKVLRPELASSTRIRGGAGGRATVPGLVGQFSAQIECRGMYLQCSGRTLLHQDCICTSHLIATSWLIKHGHNATTPANPPRPTTTPPSGSPPPPAAHDGTASSKGRRRITSPKTSAACSLARSIRPVTGRPSEPARSSFDRPNGLWSVEGSPKPENTLHSLFLLTTTQQQQVLCRRSALHPACIIDCTLPSSRRGVAMHATLPGQRNYIVVGEICPQSLLRTTDATSAPAERRRNETTDTLTAARLVSLQRP